MDKKRILIESDTEHKSVQIPNTCIWSEVPQVPFDFATEI